MKQAMNNGTELDVGWLSTSLEQIIFNLQLWLKRFVQYIIRLPIFSWKTRRKIWHMHLINNFREEPKCRGKC